LYGHMFSILLGVEFLGVKLLGHKIILHLTFWGAAKLFFTKSLPFYIPISNYMRVPILPHPHKHLLLSVFFVCLFKAILVNVMQEKMQRLGASPSGSVVINLMGEMLSQYLGQIIILYTLYILVLFVIHTSMKLKKKLQSKSSS